MGKFTGIGAKFALLSALALLSATLAASAQTSGPTIAADDRILGNANAPVALFEYSSLTCPHCAAVDINTLPKLKAEWIDTGKVKLVFRDYPLDRLALQAAILARCVPPERFFGFVDSLFKDQKNWVLMNDEAAALERVASLGSLSKQQADACLNNKDLSDAVLAQTLAGKQQYGVNSTPTFFINGGKSSGELTYDDFEPWLKGAFSRQ